MQNKYLVGAIIAVLLMAGGAWWYMSSQAPIYALSLVGGDAITSWDFKGAYEGNAELTKRANDEISRLNGLLGVENDYETYISIANQYYLIGDGEDMRKNLEHALAIDRTNTGLAWYNAGVLFEELKAYKTARAAYENAVAAQATAQYLAALRDFLKAHFPEDTAAIRAVESQLEGAGF